MLSQINVKGVYEVLYLHVSDPFPALETVVCGFQEVISYLFGLEENVTARGNRHFLVASDALDLSQVFALLLN